MSLTITELITHLEQIRAEHGDLPVHQCHHLSIERVPHLVFTETGSVTISADEVLIHSDKHNTLP